MEEEITYRQLGHGHVFDDPKKKAEMIDLRKQGYSYLEISRKYGVDHTTIIYHCRIAGIPAGIKFTRATIHLFPPIPKEKRPPKLKMLLPIEEPEIELRPGWRQDDRGGWICLGKSKTQTEIEAKERAKQKLEKRRIEMLTY